MLSTTTHKSPLKSLRGKYKIKYNLVWYKFAGYRSKIAQTPEKNTEITPAAVQIMNNSPWETLTEPVWVWYTGPSEWVQHTQRLLWAKINAK